MNLPNKLTVFRVILIVPFVLVMLGSYAEWAWYMALFGGIAGYADYIALAIFYYCEPYRSARWQDCQKI